MVSLLLGSSLETLPLEQNLLCPNDLQFLESQTSKKGKGLGSGEVSEDRKKESAMDRAGTCQGVCDTSYPPQTKNRRPREGDNEVA